MRSDTRRFHSFLFDVFALAVAGLLAAGRGLGGHPRLVTLGSPVLRSAESPPPLGIRWARAVALPLMYAAMLGLLFLVYRTFPETGVAPRAAAALFALQNGSPITLRFLVWAAHEVPLAGVVLLALAAGAPIVGLPLLISRWRLRARLRRLEANRQTAGPGSSA
jgi:hypothetical protein